MDTTAESAFAGQAIETVPAVEFMDVSLAFDAHLVLSDVNFSVAPGSMTHPAGSERLREDRVAQAHPWIAPPRQRHDLRERTPHRRHA